MTLHGGYAIRVVRRSKNATYSSGRAPKLCKKSGQAAYFPCFLYKTPDRRNFSTSHDLRGSMPSQRLPLFGGIIQPIHVTVSATTVPIFTAPVDLRSPRTYELHLWLLPAFTQAAGEEEEYTVTAQDGALGGVVWRGKSAAGGFLAGAKPIKVLDGYPVRGGVTLAMTGKKAAGADRYPVGAQMWGYLYQLGEGTAYSGERRFIGREDLPGYNAGVPFSFGMPSTPAAPDSQIIHVFEPGRLDDVSLALACLPGAAGDLFFLALLSFEDVNNVPLIPGHYVPMLIDDAVGNPAYLGSTNAQPGQNTGASSPYFLQGIPFGANPLLHHLRLRFVALEASTGVGSAHGFFIRH